MEKRVLHLPLKAVYFHQIKSGEKLFEYRLTTDYWRQRIENREYDEIHIKLGYPKKDDMSKTIIKPWRGYEEKTIVHEHFGNVPTAVFAIRVNC